MTEALKECGFEVIAEGLGVLWQPDDAALKTCFDYGVTLAKTL